jgi:small subunit ribosomal protein S6
MRRYETFIILDPDISEDQRSVVLQRTSGVIEQQGGFLAFIDDWGSRQLAYEIKKKTRGHYVRFDFCGTGPVINEMERNYRIDDRVLKYMTVLTDESPDLERVKEEIAIAESEKAKAKEQAEARELAAAQAKAKAEAQKAEPPSVDEKPPAEAKQSTNAEIADAAQEATAAEKPTSAQEATATEQAAVPQTENTEDQPGPADGEEETK